MTSRTQWLVMCGFVGGLIFVLSSCAKKHASGDDPPSYVFVLESENLLSRLEEFIDAKTAVGEKEILNRDQLLSLKNERVKEIYISVRDLDGTTRQSDVDLSGNTAILALIYDKHNNAEIWQIWPVALRLSHYPALNRDGSSIGLPFPFRDLNRTSQNQ